MDRLPRLAEAECGVEIASSMVPLTLGSAFGRGDRREEATGYGGGSRLEYNRHDV